MCYTSGNVYRRVAGSFSSSATSYRSDVARPKIIDYRLFLTLMTYNFPKKSFIGHLECLFGISVKFCVDMTSQNMD
jgi:hypothetical protein